MRDWWEVGMGEKKYTEMFFTDVVENVAMRLCQGQICTQNLSLSRMHTERLGGWCSEKGL